MINDHREYILYCHPLESGITETAVQVDESGMVRIRKYTSGRIVQEAYGHGEKVDLIFVEQENQPMLAKALLEEMNNGAESAIGVDLIQSHMLQIFGGSISAFSEIRYFLDSRDIPYQLG